MPETQSGKEGANQGRLFTEMIADQEQVRSPVGGVTDY